MSKLAQIVQITVCIWTLELSFDYYAQTLKLPFGWTKVCPIEHFAFHNPCKTNKFSTSWTAPEIHILQKVQAVRENHWGVFVNRLSHQESQFVGILTRCRYSDSSLENTKKNVIIAWNGAYCWPRWKRERAT